MVPLAIGLTIAENKSRIRSTLGGLPIPINFRGLKWLSSENILLMTSVKFPLSIQRSLVFGYLVLVCWCQISSITMGQSPNRTEVPGRFGFGWNAAASGIYLPAEPRLGQSPLTIELWVKTVVKDQSHVFASHGLQTSGDFWEIGTRGNTGKVFARFNATVPSQFETDVAIADGEWHFIAVIWDGDSIKLFVDNRMLINQAVESSEIPVHAAGLSLGTRTDQRRLTSVLLDDVRISAQARDIVAAPELPLQRDDQTLHLWDFEETQEDYLARWTPGGPTNQPNLPYPHQIAQYELAGEDDWRDGRWQDTVKGPFVSHSFLIDKYPMGAKLTAVFLEDNTTLVFDIRACSFTTALTHSEMKVDPARFGLLAKPSLTGDVIWYVPSRKTWMKRDHTQEWVPFDSNVIDYQRLNLSGNEVVFQYRVDGVEIAEHATLAIPSNKETGEHNMILRRWEVQPNSKEMFLTLAEGVSIEEAMLSDNDSVQGGMELTGAIGENSLTWQLHGDPQADVRLIGKGNDVGLLIGPHASKRTIGLSVVQNFATQPNDKLDLDLDWLQRRFSELPSFDELRQPGEPRWGEPLITSGQLAVDDGRASYLIDELTIPFNNPFKSLFFISGFDFFANGDAAICTAHGEVWRVSGIDRELKNLRWQRFATGLYQPLGLRIWNGDVVVICRDQLVRLEDTNQDGEADLYHALSHDLHTLGGNHAYAMRLEQDRQGNLYFLKSSEGPPHGASLLRWNHETGKLEVVASGFRHPYGLGIGPNDQLTVADNEGNWVPSSKIDWIESGKFYGYFEFSDKLPDDVKPERPLCYIPKFLDNSSGGQSWVPTDRRWGDYHVGEMLHFSWGRCTLHAVLRQPVDEIWQAATVRFPELVFRSGSGTGQFNPVDGQLYVVGLDGWQTAAIQDGCFSRVRHTGRTPFMPSSFEVYPNGIKIGMTGELDPEIANNTTRFQLEHWNYLWAATYGSFHYRPSSANEIGHDQLQILGVTQLDAKTLFIHTEPLQVVDQIQLTGNWVASDGRNFSEPIVGTINALPARFEIVNPATPAGTLHVNAGSDDIFSQENLIAWCVVPFDAMKRSPQQRAEMLSELGFQHLAYDWRNEHIATWDEEVTALRKSGVNLTAFWAPANTENPLEEAHWRQIMELIDRQQLKMQLWVMLNEGLLQAVPESKRVFAAANWLGPLAKQLEQRGCQLALYNHGGWAGHPDNLVAIVTELRGRGNNNAGIAYNLHHAHDILPQFKHYLNKMLPFLYSLNLNGMQVNGPKILPIGAGDNDREILSIIRESGYEGLIGILDHRDELDAAKALQENLEGLRKLTN